MAIDDIYYNVTEHQHELVEQEMKKGLPVVFFCHVPLYTPKHAEYAMKRNNHGAAYVTGAPLSITSTYKSNPYTARKSAMAQSRCAAKSRQTHA
ncbi:MAG: hypothetical protein V8Q65_02400 [Bacteroidaceae bacterium]